MPSEPLAVVALVMTGGPPPEIVMVSVAVLGPLAFPAVIVTVAVPDVVGVPEIIPVLASTDRPAGKPVALKVVGLFEAVIV